MFPRAAEGKGVNVRLGVCVSRLFAVAGFGGNDVADPAAGIGDFAGVTRDNVEWSCGMVWPAAGPSLRPRLKASGVEVRCEARCYWVQSIQTRRRALSALVSS
jgi:hypothetical protein